jgi:hypothetical protein
MGTQETSRSPEPHESHEPAIDVAQADGAHLDADAECLEDPVHCGDAHHQHDARTAEAKASVDEAGQPRT